MNSDDILNSNLVLKNLIREVEIKSAKILLGNVCYFHNFSYKKIVRYYSAKNFKPWMMFFGLMPPHTGALIHRDIYNKYGTYKKDFKIAGDFEFFLRIFLKRKIKFSVSDICVARMRTGGVSGKTYFRI